MATYFVNPATGVDNNTDPQQGNSWEKPYATAIYTMQTRASGAGMTNGDVVVCANNATETIATATLGIADTYESDNPWVMISATPATGTTITYSSGFKIKRTGASENITVCGAAALYGVELETTGASGAVYMSYNATTLYGPVQYHNCTIKSYGSVYGTSGSLVNTYAYNCTILTSQGGSPSAYGHLIINSEGNRLECYNCTISSSYGASDKYVVSTGAGAAGGRFFGCDFSGMTTTTRLLYQTGYVSNTQVLFAGCKLPASYSTTGLAWINRGGELIIERSANAARSMTAQGLVLLHGIAGTVAHNTGTYRTGGANDGDDDYSWKLVGDATYCNYYQPLVTPPITAWCPQSNPSTPVSYTVTCHFGSDTALTDQNCWADLIYSNSTTSHQDLYDSDRGVVGATGNAHATGDAWTDDTAGSFNTYKKTWTITPKYPGPVQVRFNLAGNITAYVCPKIDIAQA